MIADKKCESQTFAKDRINVTENTDSADGIVTNRISHRPGYDGNRRGIMGKAVTTCKRVRYHTAKGETFLSWGGVVGGCGRAFNNFKIGRTREEITDDRTTPSFEI